MDCDDRDIPVYGRNSVLLLLDVLESQFLAGMVQYHPFGGTKSLYTTLSETKEKYIVVYNNSIENDTPKWNQIRSKSSNKQDSS